jgi:hypothetical protein
MALTGSVLISVIGPFFSPIFSTIIFPTYHKFCNDIPNLFEAVLDRICMFFNSAN